MPAREEVRSLLDWRIVAAAVAALGVLAGGTLLASQVQGDLDAGVQQRGADAKFKSPDSTPLKLNDFKLPKDVPLQIPPGTQISPDLSKLTLPKDIDLQLPDDLDLSNLDFELPEDFKLELPEGTQFSPPGLTLPEGATIKLPDGREFKIPAGSGLSLPPEVVNRLLQQGLPAGTLNAPREFDLSGLPPDLVASLDPPAFDGGGSLHLPGGTTITLPDGTRVPFPPGVLAYAARYLLPAGTTFDIPFDSTSRSGTFPVPQPHSSDQITPGSGGGSGGAAGGGAGTPTNAIAVSTEITGMPARVRKGDTIVVSGYVRESATGRGVAGAPVDVFMNETKRAAGVLVGQGATDASGTFSIKLALPTDKPARDYQLVNHAAAFTDRSGRAFADGWGDPPFATYATTALTLDVPERDGLGAITSFGGTLLDNTQNPVASATIIVSVDGTIVARPTTTSSGRYSLSYTFSGGAHVVDARFAGNTNYEASQATRRTITIDDFAIEVPPTLRAKPGEGVTLTGRVLGRGAVAPDRTVVIDAPFAGEPIQMTSDSAGRFSYSFVTPANTAAGLYTIRYSLPQHSVSKTQTLELNQTGRLALSVPKTWDVEMPIPMVVTLLTPQGVPIQGQSIRVTLAGPGGARDITQTSDAGGNVLADLVPLRTAAGSYAVSARAVNAPHLTAPPVNDTITLGLFEVRWAAPTTVVRDEGLSGSATVTFAGKPFANTAVSLDVFGPIQGVTDSAGLVSWSITVPARATLGPANLTLQALDHPMRQTTTLVVAIPKLTIETPPTYTIGKPIPTTLRLVDDQGDPIRNQKLLVGVLDAAGDHLREVTTDARGVWTGEVNSSEYAGNVSMSARFEESSPYLAAETQAFLSSASTPLSPSRMALWILPIAAVLGAGGFGAWYYAKKRPRSAEVGAVPVAVALVKRPTDLELRFGISEGEPAVWGVGDPLELSAKNCGDAGEFELSWPGGASRMKLAEDAEARTSLTFPEEGEVTLTARRADGDFEPTSASVHIVDYRKETAREFDLFLDKARGLEPTLTRKSTPREIAWLLEARLGGDAGPKLDELALVMEITNYSDYDVAREHYLRFVRAARALDMFLGG